MQSSGFRKAALSVGALLALSCGSSPAAPSTSGGNQVTVSIVGDRGNTSFSPNPAVAAGRMVVFRNNDSVAHRVRLNDLSVDWGTIQPGATSAPLLMPSDGTNYHCQLHPTMIGAVAVSDTVPPPTCRGDYC